MRHAHAGSSGEWDGDDDDRPLSSMGRDEAMAIADLLSSERIERILSSPAVRCQQTVAPLGHRLGLAIAVAAELAEGSPGSEALRLAQRAGAGSVLCSHGDVIPDMLDVLVRSGMQVSGARRCEKASVWRLEVDGPSFVRGTYMGRVALPRP